MTLSTDVSLPREVTPTFPDRCIRCRSNHPPSHVRLATHSIGWWTWLLWVWGRRVRVDVPCCDACRSALRRQRWLRGGITTIAALGAVFFAYEYLDVIARPFRKWAAMVLGVVVLIPLFGWQIAFPPPIDITAFSDHVEYEFKDAQYALEFAMLNRVDIDR